MTRLFSTWLNSRERQSSLLSSASTLAGSSANSSIGGRPIASGRSRMSRKATTATPSATIAGAQNAGAQSASSEAKASRAQAEMRPTPAPPTLCAQFQIKVFQPRSRVENQWTRTRPDGGHPMPWNQPLMNMRTANRPTEAVRAGTKAMKRFMTADSASPNGMK